MLAVTFASLIAVGTLLLWLPFSHLPGRVSPLDAVFTATSAVCVTGLVVKDTGTDFTPFGQGVILVLIQLGGLGIMTFAAAATQLLGGKLSFRSQAALSDTIYQGNAASMLRRDLKRIVAMTFVIEAIGAALVYSRLGPTSEAHGPIFTAVFHSISAFCNAGFSLHADSLVRYRGDFVVMTTMMLLIVAGGLGHGVVLEGVRRCWNRLRHRPHAPLMWSLNTRVVVWMSLGLIAAGTVMLLFLGVGGQRDSLGGAVADAVFQSVTCRTAGFSTVDVGRLSTTGLLVMAALMFIGGSPASCAGGVKTTSVVTWYAQLRAWLRGETDVSLLGRRLPGEVVARAAMIIGLAMIWILVGGMVLTYCERGSAEIGLRDLMFEQVSAFGTVGLSTGVTPNLSVGSRIWIILSMFAGRIGPLTFAMVVSQRGFAHVRYPEERLMVG